MNGERKKRKRERWEEEEEVKGEEKKWGKREQREGKNSKEISHTWTCFLICHKSNHHEHSRTHSTTHTICYHFPHTQQSFQSTRILRSICRYLVVKISKVIMQQTSQCPYPPSFCLLLCFFRAALLPFSSSAFASPLSSFLVPLPL